MKFIDLKSLTAGILIGSIGFSTVWAAAAAKTVQVNYSINKVSVYGEEIAFSSDNRPFTLNGKAYAPIRDIAEALGCDVGYFSGSIDIGNNFKSISEKLKDAADYIGVDSPDEAVAVWENGIESRSAAKQYCVMTKQLKEKYENALAKDYGNWVTGVSSPWIDRYEIVRKEKISEKEYAYDLKFYTITSAGEDIPFHITLKIIKDGEFWHIDGINGDKQSQHYTGYAVE